MDHILSYEMQWFSFTTSSISKCSSGLPPALRWPGWGHRRAAAPPDPPSLWGSRPRCIRPRSTLTDWGRGRRKHSERETKKNLHQPTEFSVSPASPSKCESSSRQRWQRCSSRRWSPHCPLQTCPWARTERSRRTVTHKQPVVFYTAANRYSTV